MSKINWKLWITFALLAFSVWILWPSLKWSMMSVDKRERAEKEKSPILGKVLSWA